MSSVSQHRQHLTSADMDMIMRVHARVCAKNAIVTGSRDAERLAALLVREFQHGVNEEAALLTAFTTDGALRLSVPVGRMKKFIGDTPDEWEPAGKTGFH